MIAIALFVWILPAVVVLIYLAARVGKLEARVDGLSHGADRLRRPSAPAPEVQHAPVPPPPAPSPAPEPPPPVRTFPPAAPAAASTIPASAFLDVALPPRPEPFQEPAAPAQSHVEWESLIGGNWLNKLGVFLLVVGIALALGYSFAHIGPAGRVAVSLAVSVAMLISGVIVEPREKYRIFARGLIGGGWAALYFTVYAMYAVQAARILDDPFTAAVLLFAVSAGMIGHSLRYRSETVAGLAYFIAFATLAITDVTTFSVIALLPLAASLLYIARRFEWRWFAHFGLIATYATCALRPDTGAPLWTAQTLFTIYWLLFECFDLLVPDSWMVPLNAMGFLMLSVVKWSRTDSPGIWLLLAVTAATHLMGGILRARANRWHASMTIATALAAMAVLIHADASWAPYWLLAEAELLYLAGVWLDAPGLRYLASAVFSIEVLHVAWHVERVPSMYWTPAAAVTTAVFYANRALRAADVYFGYAAAALLALIAGYRAPRNEIALTWLLTSVPLFALGLWLHFRDFRFQAYALAALGAVGMAAPAPPHAPGMGAAILYAMSLTGMLGDRFEEDEAAAVRLVASMGAAALTAAFLWKVVPPDYRGIAWMLLAAALFELGRLGYPGELRQPSYGMAGAAAGLVVYGNLVPLVNYGPWPARLIPGAAGLLCYAFATRTREDVSGVVPAIASAAGTVFIACSLWASLMHDALAPGWAIFALVLLLARLRWHAAALAAAAFAWSWLGPWREAGIVVACLYAAQVLTSRDSRMRPAFSLMATIRLAGLLFDQVSGSMLTIAWGAQGVMMLAAGFPLRDRVLRLSGLALLAGCILKLFAYDLSYLDTLPRILSFIVLGLILVGVSWIYTRFREQLQRYL